MPPCDRTRGPPPAMSMGAKPSHWVPIWPISVARNSSLQTRMLAPDGKPVGPPGMRSTSVRLPKVGIVPVQGRPRRQTLPVLASAKARRSTSALWHPMVEPAPGRLHPGGWVTTGRPAAFPTNCR